MERDAAMVRRYQASTNQEEIDFALLQKLLTVICGLGSNDGTPSASQHSHSHLLPTGEVPSRAEKRAGGDNGVDTRDSWGEG